MTTRPYELLARFAADGKIAGVSVRLITTVNGRDYEGDPSPLSGASDPAFIAFAEQFAASAMAERDQAIADLAKLQSQFDSAVQQLTQLQDDKDALQSQVNSLTDQVAASSNQIAEGSSDKISLEARIAELTSRLPYDPRKITVPAFLNRLTPASMLMLFSDEDPGVQQIGGMLKEWSVGDENGPWPILLDSEEFVGAMTYLVAKGKLTEKRVAEITMDSSREESGV